MVPAAPGRVGRLIRRRVTGVGEAPALKLKLFLTCWLIFSLHFATNTVREIYPALSLADRFSLDVSEYAGMHPDIFELPGRGTYINNNVGASILGAIPYFLARPVVDAVVERIERKRAREGVPTRPYKTIYPMAQDFLREARARGLDVKFALAAGVMQAFLMAPLSALAVVLMFQLLCDLGIRRRAGLALALLYGFATPVFYRTAQLNHNLLLCHAGFFAFVLLFRTSLDKHCRLWVRFLGAGLLGGFAVVLDYTGFVTAAAIGLYGFVLWRATRPRNVRALLCLIGGITTGVLLLWAIQWTCFGHPLWPAQLYMPETTYSGHGYRGMGLPDLELLWQIAFSTHYGLFTSAPFLVLALWPFSWRKHYPHVLANRELAFALLFTLAIFTFTAANQFARMQFNSGVRHVVPAVPFVFFIAISVLRQMRRWQAVAFATLTTAWSWFLAMARDVEQSYGVATPMLTVLRDGPQLPWLTTLQRMGYVPDGPWAGCLILAVAGGILAIWTLGPRASSPRDVKDKTARPADFL